MSNVTTVQELYAAFGRGDVPGILSRLADDVVWESEGPASDSLSGIRHGKAETVGFFEAIGKDHGNPKLTISEYIDAGDNVITIGRYTATMNSTGRIFESPTCHVWKFRNGKVVKYIGFSNTAAGLEARQPLSSSAAR